MAIIRRQAHPETPRDWVAYLARYTHRVAIANSRLVSLDERGMTLAGGEPVARCCALALGAMAVAAGIVSDAAREPSSRAAFG